MYVHPGPSKALDRGDTGRGWGEQHKWELIIPGVRELWGSLMMIDRRRWSGVPSSDSMTSTLPEGTSTHRCRSSSSYEPQHWLLPMLSSHNLISPPPRSMSPQTASKPSRIPHWLPHLKTRGSRTFRLKTNSFRTLRFKTNSSRTLRLKTNSSRTLRLRTSSFRTLRLRT